ncbi:hypothetical protein [Bosea sp. 117]|uniref:hypothetical protein n=1 Tax=Bosea sp. 117 TaxID=1125973 RepID=UPI0012DF68A7|nr:hypothetical protein [Bosea sp. 117]
MEENISDESKLVAALADLGGRTNNAKLREKLGWSTEEYLPIRNSARTKGLIGIGMGRGGVVFLIDASQQVPEVQQNITSDGDQLEESTEFKKESVYYNRIYKVLNEAWVDSQGLDDYYIEITASKRVRNSGRWTVPDIVVVGRTIWQYVPGFEYTIQTFEIKRYEALDNLAVFEALNHKRSANYSYLVVVNSPVPNDADSMLSKEYKDKINPIKQLCEENNIGLIVIGREREEDYDSWRFIFDEAVKNNPDPENIDGFIKQYISNNGKEVISKMIR